MTTRADALADGLNDRAIAKKLASGDWHRVRQGAYIALVLWDELDDVDRHRVVALAVSRRAQCAHAWSHATALAQLGMPIWGQSLDDVHLTRFDGRAGRREAGVVQHKGQVVADDLTMREGRLVTSGTRTALDVASLCDVERGVVAVGSLLHAGETTLSLLHRRLEGMDRRPETLKLRRVLQLADPRPESVAEHRLVYWCWRLGLPAPIPQYEVIADGRRYRLDFAWPEHKVWMEFDGKNKYDHWLRPGESPADAVFREKRREDLIRETTGWICIRVTWADLANPRSLEQRLRRALRLPAA